jgi:ADP-heptose:LPS heptosyltransferase
MDPLTSNENLLSPALSATLIEQLRKWVELTFNFEHKGIIAINPNASDLRYERRWARESFAAVAKYFAQKGYAVALVGASSEHAYVQEIIEQLGNDAERTRNVAGAFSLIEFFAFLGQCKLVVTNDSGVMNMALTLQVPQLLLAGPVNPDQYFIPNEFRTYIYYQTYCSPCTHYVDIPPCAGDNICMQQIQPEEVIYLCERLLCGETVKPKRNTFFTYHSQVLGVLKNKGK